MLPEQGITIGTKATEPLLRVTYTSLPPSGLPPTFFPSVPTNRVIIAKEKEHNRNINRNARVS